MSESGSTPTPPGGQSSQPVFHVEKVYMKDFSFESPNAPQVFGEQSEPKVEFNLDTKSTKMGEDHYEVMLHVVLNVKHGETVMFLVDVTYAGLFLLKNFPPEHVTTAISVECPHILFPYIRQVVSHAVGEGGFKPLVLDPINFAAVFHQAQQKKAAQAQNQSYADSNPLAQ
ncbi:MAG: protein-export chaperone SecB [Magnetococcales bacterium]|nr:protein-export chaperone SecB [Magnetococcales bacterium]